MQRDRSCLACDFSLHKGAVASNIDLYVLNINGLGPQCPDLLAVTIGTYLSDSKWRQPFANATVASIILSLIESSPTVSFNFNQYILCLYLEIIH